MKIATKVSPITRHHRSLQSFSPLGRMSPLKLAAIPFLVALALGPMQASAAPVLNPALASFAVLGAEGVTNVATSTIGGNLGSSPNPSVGSGYAFTNGGSLQANTPLAAQAQFDLDTAITALNGMANTGGTLGADLVGLTLAPGVYDVLAGTTNLSGLLSLDGGASNTAVWVIRFASTFIMSEGSDVNVTNIGDGSGVGIYWTVGSAATLDGDTLFGNVFADTLISSNGGLTVGCGRLASATAQVSLIKDNISLGCTGFESSGGFDQGVDIGLGGGEGGVGVVPEPATLALFGLGLAGIGFSRRRRA